VHPFTQVVSNPQVCLNATQREGVQSWNVTFL